jgi:osmoprotectant transport system permease protein
MSGAGSHIISDAIAWLNDPLNWSGPHGIGALTVEHLGMSGAAVLLGAGFALPLGLWLGHRHRGGQLTVLLSNVSRAMPTLALLTLFASSAIGFGNRAVVIAAAIFAVPPVLTNTFTGMLEVDADVLDAARGMGTGPWRMLWHVEVPLALPVIAAGVRTAAVQVVATVPLAALVAGGGLGVIINTGLSTLRYGQVLAGGVLVAVLSMSVEGLLAGAQRLLTPRFMTTRRTGQ